MHDVAAAQQAWTDPRQWSWARSSPPHLSSEACTWRGALLRSWSGTSPVMVQPSLDRHYLVMHLGGAKRVTRRGDGPGIATIVENESLTLVPAGTSYVWRTEGPIAFAHLYIEPSRIDEVLSRDLAIDAPGATLVDRVGCRDPFIEPLMARMLCEIGRGPGASSLLLDSLYESLCVRLAQRHSSRAPGRDAKRIALAPHRLRRVLDFIDAHLAANITLADLSGAAGSSQSHFCRAFRIAMGCSPYRYVLRQRIEWGKVMLLTREMSLTEVGTNCGFSSRHQFAVTFRGIVGVGPKRFRSLCLNVRGHDRD